EVKIIQFNQISALEIDEKIDSEKGEDDKEIDESTIKILSITWLASILPLKKGKENQKDSQKLSQLFLKNYKKQFPTFSLMYPIIRELQNKFLDVSLELNDNNEDNDDDNDILDSEDENDDTPCAPPPPSNLDQIEKKFKIVISNSLNKYWHDFCDIGLAREKLKNEFENLQHLNFTNNYQLEQQTSTSI
ncbi:22077_t:CDS:2, partial [Racocetra persica]